MEKETLKNILYVSCLFIVTFSFIHTTNKYKRTIENLEFRIDSLNQEIDTLSDISFSQKLLREEIVKQNIKHPNIVLKQAILESGYFTSYGFRKRNNLFGFHNGKKYLEFENWKKCVKYYKKWQDEKYEKGDYYAFLCDLPYAEDSSYVDVLKSIKINI